MRTGSLFGRAIRPAAAAARFCLSSPLQPTRGAAFSRSPSAPSEPARRRPLTVVAREPRRRRGALAALPLLLVALCGPARADLAVNQVIVDFVPGAAAREDVQVANTGDETLYVETTVHRIYNPGDRPLQREEIRDPAAGGLLVSPRRFVLPPGDRRLLRFVLTQPAGAEERIYRVSVTPKVNPVAAGSSGIKILVAYEMLVIVRPIPMRARLDVRREGRRLVATNAGNTNVLLSPIRQCRTESDCVDADGARVYPGRTVAIELPLDVPAQVYRKVGDETAVEVY
jgi:P pilus assembly chaperone PapD